MHQRGVLHRDIQLGNCVLGLEPKEKTIYMIDFGFSKFYLDQRTGRHIPDSNEPRDFIGNYWFSSVRVHCRNKGAHVHSFDPCVCYVGKACKGFCDPSSSRSPNAAMYSWSERWQVDEAATQFPCHSSGQPALLTPSVPFTRAAHYRFIRGFGFGMSRHALGKARFNGLNLAECLVPHAMPLNSPSRAV